MSKFKRLDSAVHRAKLEVGMVVVSTREDSDGFMVEVCYYNGQDFVQTWVHEDFLMTLDETVAYQVEIQQKARDALNLFL